MECFLHSTIRTATAEAEHNGLLSFYIPDIGIIFRAQFKGDPKEVEYAALLALLEFAEINPQLFKHKALEIYSDSFALVNQVNNRMYCSRSLEPFRNLALLMKKKVPYTLSLIPAADNPAVRSMA